MDFQTGMLCIVVAVVSSVIIYIISISPVKENSFEEAKATRKKLLKQYFDESRQINEKSKEKKSKKAKKAKDKSSEPVKTHEPTPDITVKESKEDVEKLSKRDPRHNILFSDEETANVKEAGTAKKELKENKKSKTNFVHSNKQENQKQIKSSKDLPKNNSSIINIENSQSNEAKAIGPQNMNGNNAIIHDTKSKTLNTDATVTKVKKDDDVKEPPPKISQNHSKDTQSKSAILCVKDVKESVPKISQNHSKDTQNKTSILNVKSAKKKRSDVAAIQQLSNDKDAVNINLLMTLLQKAELSRSEIQLLIDALLNKQQEDNSEWLKGRQDPLVKLKKQLAEKDKALFDEQQATTGLQSKLKELRGELNTEKNNLKVLEENFTSKQEECKALSKKLQEATEESKSLILKSQQLQQQLKEEHLLVTKLEEEQTTQKKVCATHTEQHHEVVQALKGHMDQLAAKLQEQEGMNNTLSDEVTASQERIKMQEDYAVDMERKLNNAFLDVQRLQEKLAEERNEMTTALKKFQNENKSLQEENDRLSDQVAAVCQEKLHLMEVNETVVSKETRENGDMMSFTHKEDFRTMLEEKDRVLNELHENFEKKEVEIQKLNNDIIIWKNEANKKQTVLDNISIEISELRSQTKNMLTELNEKKDVISQLSSELYSKKNEITTLRKEVDSHKQRNNELRNKNWKVMEALAAAEQALLKKGNQVKVPEYNKDKYEELKDLKNQVSQLFQRIFPDVSVEEIKDVDIWLKNMEEAAFSAKYNQLKTGNMVTDLELRIQQLETVISHYKTVIDDTEGMLNSLQEHIEIEETRWGDKIKSLQAELEHYKCQNRLKGNCSNEEKDIQNSTENESQEIQ